MIWTSSPSITMQLPSPVWRPYYEILSNTEASIFRNSIF